MRRSFGYDTIDLSVIVCTRNRSKSLQRTLRSFERLSLPPDLSWEIVIVDNGSVDDTCAAVDAFKTSLPVLSIREDRAGLSNARNCGMKEAQGKYIVWTDDDVEVHAQWLSAYISAFKRYPNVVLFGGPSIPVFEKPAATWMQSNKHVLRDLLAIRTFGPDPTPISLEHGAVPFGLNYGVRADVQRQFLYDPGLGVAPNRRISGEEVDFYERLLNAGFSGLCLASPVVYHHIPTERQTLDYAKSYYFSAGETAAILRYRRRLPTTREIMISWTKFVLVRMISIMTRVLPTSLRISAIIRQAFHEGRVRRIRGLIRQSKNSSTQPAV